MQKLSKIIRVLTAPPFIAFLLFGAIFISKPKMFTDTAHFVFSLVFFCVFPVLSYGFVRIIPSLKKGGRKTERKTAVIFSCAGYIFATVFLLLFGFTSEELIICLTYLFSGIIIGVCSLFNFKASGHASGVSGPFTCLGIFISPYWFLGYILLVPTFWASIKSKRHNLLQLIIGTAIPIVITLALIKII